VPVYADHDSSVLAGVPVEDPVHAVFDQFRSAFTARANPLTDGAVLGFVAWSPAGRPQERPVLPPLQELSVTLDDQRRYELDPHTSDVPGSAIIDSPRLGIRDLEGDIG
jgi:hypothetical protein